MPSIFSEIAHSLIQIPYIVICEIVLDEELDDGGIRLFCAVLINVGGLR